MKTTLLKSVVFAAAALAILGAASAAGAQGEASEKHVELSVMGGVQALSKNDTSIPDDILNVPLIGSVGYQLSPVWVVEGEFMWLIPVQQSVDMASGRQDLKTPDVLTYQVNMRAHLPMSSAAWSPYVAVGAGGVTFLSDTGANRAPALAKSETMFGINFGGGVTYGLSPSWGVRADFREFAALPAHDQTGFSSNGNADTIWMSRGTLGVAYRF